MERTFGTRSIRTKLWRLTQETEALLQKVDQQLRGGKRVAVAMLSQRNQLAATLLRCLTDLERIRIKLRR